MSSDLEMTKLCAEAMGWNWKEHGSLFISSGTGPWEAYDPLHDDAQAMALELSEVTRALTASASRIKELEQQLDGHLSAVPSEQSASTTVSGTPEGK